MLQIKDRIMQSDIYILLQFTNNNVPKKNAILLLFWLVLTSTLIIMSQNPKLKIKQSITLKV